jgi:hypothetical protein
MEPEWWEGIVRFLSNYWWMLLLIVIFGLIVYFTKGFGLL